MTRTQSETSEHTCYGRIFCGTPRAVARAECPACSPTAERVATYARLANATDNSIARQQQMLDDYVRDELDASIVTPFIDASTRYTSTSRPQLDQLVAKIKRDELDVIVVVSLDRFGRRLLDILSIVDICREHGTRIVDIREGEISEQRIETLHSLADFERRMLDNRASRRNGNAR